MYINQPGATSASAPRGVAVWMKRPHSAPCVISMSSPLPNMWAYMVFASGIQDVPEPSRVMGVPTSVVLDMVPGSNVDISMCMPDFVMPCMDITPFAL